MTNEQTLEQFLKVLNTNAYLGIFECSDMENAISALEKQIPKKPTEKAQEGFDFEVAHCLVCSYCNAPIVNVWSKAEYKPKFCHYCGQALDWSE